MVMKKNILLRPALSLLITAAFIVSCTTAPDEVQPPVPGDGNMVTFRASVPASSQVATRVLSYEDEYAVETIDVLVFQNDVFAYSVSGVITVPPSGNVGNNATMEFRVPIIVSDIPNDFMIVANARDMIGGLSEGDTPADVAAALQMDFPETGWWVFAAGNPNYKHMPMWGYLKDQTIDEAYLGQPQNVKLTRMLAKIDVMLGDEVPAEKFTLNDVRVYNFATRGNLVPDLSFAWESADFSLADYTAPSLPAPWGEIMSDGENQFIDAAVTDGRGITGNFYFFEAPAGVAPTTGIDDFVVNPCIVVGGSYEGGDMTYYRIDFARKDAADAADDGDTEEMNYLPILRNNSYTITINKVSGPGHKTPEDAYNSVPVNIDAMIINWNGNDIKTGITDGRYTLGITSEYYELIPDAHTAPGDDNLLTIATNYPDGWQAAVYSDRALTSQMINGWLRLSAYEGVANYPDGQQIFFLANQLPPETESRTAWVKVTAGTMTYVIEVTQVQMYIRVTAVGGPNNGQVIETISFASNNTMLSEGAVTTRASAGIPPDTQSFKVEWGPASKPLRVVKLPATGTDAMLSWQDPSSAITYLTEQNTVVPGEQTFKVDPLPFRLETITEYPFYREGTTMLFELEGTQLTKHLTLDMTHYNLVVSGVEDSSGSVAGKEQTVTVRSNVPWQVTLADGQSILVTDPKLGNVESVPYKGEANVYGSTFTYNFSGYVGSATFTFVPQPGAQQFTPVIEPVTSQNITSRFAKSNIVMVASGANKILTFAETEEDWGDDVNGDGLTGKSIFGIRRVIPADAVGLFFKWGSLVGISPNGETGELQNQTLVDLTVGPTSEVVFWPNEYNAKVPATSWVYSSFTVDHPDQIPYINIHPLQEMLPEWVNSVDRSMSAYDTKFPGVGYSAVDGVGDICRYISAQSGWVTGKWRIPTDSEMTALQAETSSTAQFGVGVPMTPPLNYRIPQQGTNGLYGFTSMPGGRFIGATAINADNTANPVAKASIFFPASGRVGYHDGSSDADLDYYEWAMAGLYFSSTLSAHPGVNTILYGLTFAIDYDYLDSTTITPTTSHIYSVPVRCIRDDAS